MENLSWVKMGIGSGDYGSATDTLIQPGKVLSFKRSKDFKEKLQACTTLLTLHLNF
jgi:hypothetical protein